MSSDSVKSPWSCTRDFVWFKPASQRFLLLWGKYRMLGQNSDITRKNNICIVEQRYSRHVNSPKRTSRGKLIFLWLFLWKIRNNSDRTVKERLLKRNGGLQHNTINFRKVDCLARAFLCMVAGIRCWISFWVQWNDNFSGQMHFFIFKTGLSTLVTER